MLNHPPPHARLVSPTLALPNIARTSTAVTGTMETGMTVGMNKMMKKAVITVTSIAGPTGSVAPSNSGSTKIPIGPIVGGIVAGVAAVLIIGGIWFWCHRKAEKEKEEARQRAAARAARKNGTARPTLIKNKSAVSDAPSEKDISGHHPQGRHQAPPVPVIPSQYLVSKHGHAQQQQQAYGQEGGYDRYAERDGEYYSSHASTEMNTHGTSPTSSTGSHTSVTQPRPTVPPPAPTNSSSSSSGSDRRSRAQQRIEAATAAKEREAAMAAANPIGRYAPARPSPLRAEERKDDDEDVPKWGSKPFRSANTSTSNTNNQENAENNSTPPISLAPPIDTSGRDKAVSGEWGVAYSDVDDGAGAFEHDDYDTRSDGRKSMGADLSTSIPMTSSGRQPTGYAYDPSTSPRSRAVSGGAPDVYAQQQYHYQPQYQQQQYQAQDPYAQSRYAYQNDEDPYAPSPARRDVGRGGY